MRNEVFVYLKIYLVYLEIFDYGVLVQGVGFPDATRDIFSTKFSLKPNSAGGKCLLCHMTSVGWLEIMIQRTPSIMSDFHFPVDFRLDIFFPHIFWFLHQNWVGINGFTLTKFRYVGDEEKTIPSCLDTSNPMIAPPLHFAAERIHQQTGEYLELLRLLRKISIT